jgi:uracil phosphoribosyltransferase
MLRYLKKITNRGIIYLKTTERDFIMSKFQVIEHPLIQHKLTIMRKKETTTREFKQLLDEISMLMGYEITRNLPTEDIEIETPICKTVQKRISGKKLAIVPILRAGLGMVDGLLRLVPVARVGHIGLYRDPETHLPVEYYCKMPPELEERQVIIVDPMLATGGSASDAITMVKAKGAKNIMMMCLVASPEGVKKVQEDHPDVDIYAAALDECLNDHAYIVPGLGDAGDRIFGTK